MKLNRNKQIAAIDAMRDRLLDGIYSTELTSEEANRRIDASKLLLARRDNLVYGKPY